MNATQRRRLNRLATYLESVPPEHFDMTKWFTSHVDNAEVLPVTTMRRYLDANGADVKTLVNQPHIYRTPEAAIADCGTAACVAGHAAALFKLRPRHSADYDDSPRVSYNWGMVAGDFLGLVNSQREGLFQPNGYWKDEIAHRFTPTRAAAAVRELAATGEVPVWWSRDECRRAPVK